MTWIGLIESEPTGDVNGVTWKLLAGLCTIGAMAIGWLAKRLSDKEAEIKELNAARLQDRRDFEAQTNVLIKNIFKLKSGGTINDS